MKNTKDKKIQEWKSRPKGCTRTISGMHIPIEKYSNYTIEFYCSACGKIDDTGEFQKWFRGELPKIDDSNNDQH